MSYSTRPWNTMDALKQHTSRATKNAGSLKVLLCVQVQESRGSNVVSRLENNFSKLYLFLWFPLPVLSSHTWCLPGRLPLPLVAWSSATLSPCLTGWWKPKSRDLWKYRNGEETHNPLSSPMVINLDKSNMLTNMKQFWDVAPCILLLSISNVTTQWGRYNSSNYFCLLFVLYTINIAFNISWLNIPKPWLISTILPYLYVYTIHLISQIYRSINLI